MLLPSLLPSWLLMVPLVGYSIVQSSVAWPLPTPFPPDDRPFPFPCPYAGCDPMPDPCQIFRCDPFPGPLPALRKKRDVGWDFSINPGGATVTGTTGTGIGDFSASGTFWPGQKPAWGLGWSDSFDWGDLSASASFGSDTPTSVGLTYTLRF